MRPRSASFPNGACAPGDWHMPLIGRLFRDRRPAQHPATQCPAIILMNGALDPHPPLREGRARGAPSRHGYAGEQCAELGVLTQVETLLNWLEIA